MRVKMKDGTRHGKSFIIVTSRDQLLELTNISGFLENPLAEGEWKLKTMTGVISLDAESLKSPLAKLSQHSVLLISGPQRVGKSTLLLYLIDRCLQENISPWKIFVFIDPYLTPGDLKTCLYELETELTSRDYDPRQILFAVDGLKRTGETDDNCANKCQVLFEWISDRKYKLIASVRDDQKRTLERVLNDKEKDGLERWRPLDLGDEFVAPEKKFEKVKALLVKYLMYDPYKAKIRLPMTFDDTEFNDCVQAIAEKSEGLPGYIVFAVEHMAANSKKFSREAVESLPEGWIQLIWDTIRKDYFVQRDKSLPLLFVFLSRQEHAVTGEFIESLLNWGMDELDKEASVDRKKICAKKDNWLTFHTEQPFFELEKKRIQEYELKDYMKEAIEKGLPTCENHQHYDEVTSLFSYVNIHFESLIASHHFGSFQKGLEEGELSPQDFKVWLRMADFAKIWGCQKIHLNAKLKVLRYVTQFFIDNARLGSAHYFEWQYLKIVLSLILEGAIDAMSVSDCDIAIGFFKQALADKDDWQSRWTLGQLHEKKNERADALRWYVESSSIQNTSRGYGSLIQKLRSFGEGLPYEIQVEYLELREAVAVKAIQCYALFHRNWSDLAEALMHKADIFLQQGKFEKAIKNLDDATTAYIKGIEVIEKVASGSCINDKSRYQIRIAVIMGKRAYAKSRIGRLEQSVEDIQSAMKIKRYPSIQEETHEDEKWLFRYNKWLVTREFISPLMESIVNLGELAVKGEEEAHLSNQWFTIKLRLDDVEPHVIRGDLDDLRLSALSHALSDDPTNEEAQQALIELGGSSYYESHESGFLRHMSEFTSKYHQGRADSLDQKRKLLVLLQKCFSAIIWTSDFCDHLLRRRDIRNEKFQRHNLSSVWSEISWIIKEVFLSSTPRELVAKCLELSLWFSKENVGSWFTLGCEYLQEGKTDLAMKAFTEIKELDHHQEPGKTSYLSEIGIGKIHEKKREFALARDSLVRASCLLREYGEEESESTVNSLVAIAENLKDLASSVTDTVSKKEIMVDVLEIYNQALEISKAQSKAVPEVLLERISWSRNWIHWLDENIMNPSLSLNDLLEASLAESFDIHLRSVPNDARGWRNRGKLFQEFGGANNEQEAIKCFSRALEIEPEEWNTWVDKIHSTLRLEMHKRADEISDFVASADLVKEAIGKIAERSVERFKMRVRKSVVHCFKKAIFEDYVNSREELFLVLGKFERTQGRLVETPLESEILDSCRRDKDYSIKKNKVSEIFNL